MSDDSRAAKNIKKGWIPLLKSTITHDTVGFKKPFSRFEAWVWLLSETNWEGSGKLMSFGGKERFIDCPAGTVTHSERFMASAWGWSRKKLRNYLFLLEQCDQITLKVVQQIRQITIVNWDVYRKYTSGKEPAGLPAENRQGYQQGTKHKEANKLINKEGVKKIILRAEEFKLDAEKYIPAYGPELVRSFFLFWSEKDDNEMMRFETQKAWHLKTALNSFALAAYFKSTLDTDDRKKIKKKDVDNWLNVFDQCQRIDKYNYDQLHDIIEYFRIVHDEENGDDFKWRNNFLSPVKLRRPNREGIKYIDYFWHQIKEKVDYGD
jgi:hypothetical protein